MPRFVAFAMAVALLVPPLAGLVCDWTCIAQHRAHETTSSCHEHDSRSEGPALTAAHRCHDLADGAVVVRPASAQESGAGLVTTTAERDLTDPVRTGTPIALIVPGDPPARPPRPLPLRI